MIQDLPKDASIVILTGAGISAESGLNTFRGDDGLWEGHRVEDVATPEAFMRNPELVHDFYNQRRRGLLDPAIQPNPAHEALAVLEQKWRGDVLVVTQNIDDLHERGGTKNLLHMHGEVLKGFCTNCRDTGGHTNETVEKFIISPPSLRGSSADEAIQSHTQTSLDCRAADAARNDVFDKIDMSVNDACQTCGYTGGLRPDIVWFGEMPYYMNEIFEQLQNCDLFISIGTSGNVYPAAGFVQAALQASAYTVEINLEPANNSSAFHQHIHGKAGTEVPNFVEMLLS